MSALLSGSGGVGHPQISVRQQKYKTARYLQPSTITTHHPYEKDGLPVNYGRKWHQELILNRYIYNCTQVAN